MSFYYSVRIRYNVLPCWWLLLLSLTFLQMKQTIFFRFVHTCTFILPKYWLILKYSCSIKEHAHTCSSGVIAKLFPRKIAPIYTLIIKLGFWEIYLCWVSSKCSWKWGLGEADLGDLGALPYVHVSLMVINEKKKMHDFLYS